MRRGHVAAGGVGGGGANQPVLAGEQAGDQVFVVERVFAAAQGDVGVGALQVEQAVVKQQLGAHGGMFGQQAFEAAAQRGMGGHARRQGDADGAGDFAVYLRKQREGVFRAAQQAAAGLGHGAPRVGGRERACAAVEQLHAVFALQMGDMLADRRRAHAELLRGGGHRAAFEQGGEHQ